MNESEFHQWIYARSEGAGPEGRVLVGPGDDMAIVAWPIGDVMPAVDQVLDGVHFDLAECGAKLAGRKAMARNLSDVAAMGALPMAAVVAVALPEGFSQTDAELVYEGIRELADEYHCPIVGGDVAAWRDDAAKLAITVTILARQAGTTAGVSPVLRSGARAGNAICVTGRLGGAWQTGRDLEFTPRVLEGILLNFRHKLLSMIDISDGLAKDLSRLCEASGGIGAELIADAIPVHPDATAGREIDPLDAALFDGEDYELLFTVPRGRLEALLNDPQLPCEVSHIGWTTKEPGLRLRRGDETADLAPDGWDHATK